MQVIYLYSQLSATRCMWWQRAQGSLAGSLASRSGKTRISLRIAQLRTFPSLIRCRCLADGVSGVEILTSGLNMRGLWAMGSLQQMVEASARTIQLALTVHRRAILQVCSVPQPWLAVYLGLALFEREEKFLPMMVDNLFVPHLPRQPFCKAPPAHLTRCSSQYAVPRHAGQSAH